MDKDERSSFDGLDDYWPVDSQCGATLRDR
jgi:hypothetical protein